MVKQMKKSRYYLAVGDKYRRMVNAKHVKTRLSKKCIVEDALDKDLIEYNEDRGER